MMGDRDFRAIIQNSLDSIGRELQLDIDSENLQICEKHVPENARSPSEQFLKILNTEYL